MNCQHERSIIIPTPDGPHHAKMVCVECDAFLRWMPKPETAARQALNATRIVALRKCPALGEWERGFIATLDEQGPKLSPKQQAKLDELFVIHCEPL